jgi:hypothetical protein
VGVQENEAAAQKALLENRSLVSVMVEDGFQERNFPIYSQAKRPTSQDIEHLLFTYKLAF